MYMLIMLDISEGDVKPSALQHKSTTGPQQNDAIDWSYQRSMPAEGKYAPQDNQGHLITSARDSVRYVAGQAGCRRIMLTIPEGSYQPSQLPMSSYLPGCFSTAVDSKSSAGLLCSILTAREVTARADTACSFNLQT